MRRWTTLLLAAVLLALVGCGEELPEAELTFITGTEHHDLDPQKVSWLHDGRLLEQLYEPLVDFNFNTMQIEPGVAERWTVSDDRLTYTFHLREDARWSNGDPVTAHDFHFAWRRALLQELAADYTDMLFKIEGARAFFDWRAEQIAQYQQIREQVGGAVDAGTRDAAEAFWTLTKNTFDEMVGIEPKDERTLVVRLEQPTPYFLQLAAFVTFMPVHADSIRQAQTIDAGSGLVRMDSSYWGDPNRLVTNGPYRLAGHAPRRFTHLVANEHYWGAGAVTCASVLERVVSNPATALQVYENGNADFLPDLPSTSSLAVDLAARGREDVHVQAMAGTYFFNFNCQPTLPDGRENPLADERVRRALAMAVDREAIVRQITRLDQTVARSFVPPGVMADYEPPTDAGIAFDPERAKALLAEAGHAGGEGLEMLSIIYNTDAAHEGIAVAVRDMWQRHLGLDVPLEGMRSKALGDRLDNRTFTIARAGWFGDYPDPTTFLNKMRSGSNNNDAGWMNEEYDRLLDRADRATGAERVALLQQAERVLLNEAPMLLMFQYRSVYAWRSGLRGLRANPWASWSFEEVEGEE